MESYKKEVFQETSWIGGFSNSNYYGIANSFQYSENINIDDDNHGIKLSQKVNSANILGKYMLIQAGDYVYGVPTEGGKVVFFNDTNWQSPKETDITLSKSKGYQLYGGACVFQEYLWIGINIEKGSGGSFSGFGRIPIGMETGGEAIVPYDHPTFDDDDIKNEGSASVPPSFGVSAILNFNNARLLLACGNELRCYYPELDNSTGLNKGKTGWKLVQNFWGGQEIIGLSNSFQYLKVRVRDHSGETKIFYYNANDDFRSCFAYNMVNLTGCSVKRIYSINNVDYFTTSEGPRTNKDSYVVLNKLVGTTVVPIFKRRGGLVEEDISPKQGGAFFIGPTTSGSCYETGAFYIGDTRGIYKFLIKENSVDVGYLKRVTNNTTDGLIPYGIAICDNYIYMTDSEGIHQTWLYDSAYDGYDRASSGYQESGFLISREYEGSQYQGCFTKMLDELRCHYELNPKKINGKIEIFLSPNNTRTDTNPSGTGSDGRYKVLEINDENKHTCLQEAKLFNTYNGFNYDRQSITYMIKITRGSNELISPIVRNIQMVYHIKGKNNYINELN